MSFIGRTVGSMQPFPLSLTNSSVAGIAAGALLFLSVPFASPVHAQTILQDTLEVTVLDNADELAPEDEDFLSTETPKIDFLTQLPQSGTSRSRTTLTKSMMTLKITCAPNTPSGSKQTLSPLVK